MTINGKAYVAMRQVINESNHLQHYHDDFYVIDASRLGVSQIDDNERQTIPHGMPFGWVVRDAGTELVAANEKIGNCGLQYYAKNQQNARNHIDNCRKSPISMMMNEKYCLSEPPFLYFWWDGQTLKQVPSIATIFDFMRNYQESID